MKRAMLLPFLLAALAALAAMAAPGDKLPVHFKVVPLQTNLTAAEIVAQASTGTTIPMFTYTVTAAKDNSIRSGTMTGRSPFARGKTTTIVPTVLVPLTVTIGGATFDPTVPDACFGGGTYTDVQLVANSPIFQDSSNTINGINVGNTQYPDAFRRANFWASLAGSPYHTLLSSPVTVAATQTVPSSVTSNGTTGEFGVGGACGLLGVLNFTAFDNYVKGTLIPALSGTVAANTFPIIVMHNVVLSSAAPPNFTTCCTLGYHGAFATPTIQTYAVADFDVSQALINTSDVSAMTHEVGEWMDDPLGTNATPAWGHIGQVSACQSNLEVGDPLSGSVAGLMSTTINNVTYHMQELAFFSWFMGGPSLGASGKFSNNGTFGGASKPCPPGGTN
jgi:hypothetical protein